MLTSMQAGVWLTKLDERCQESKRFLQVSVSNTVEMQPGLQPLLP